MLIMSHPLIVFVISLTEEKFHVLLFVAIEMVTVIDGCDQSIVMIHGYIPSMTC